jgi:amino acid adenylation domain-containing protein/FkbM family methyltransferase
MKELPGTFDTGSSDRDLFELLLDEDGLGGAAASREMRRHGMLSAPLSLGQTRLWFFEQMEPGTATYNMPGGLSLDGQLSVSALESALLEIVRRQESLRTSIKDAAGEGRQVVDPAASIYPDARYAARLVDVSGVPEPERNNMVQRLARDEARRPFDLSRAPLFRLSLVRSAARKHILLITLHHIISDEWSLSVFADELTALYCGFAYGLPSDLEEPGVQYSDIAIWQREWLEGEDWRREAEFWKQALEGAPSSIELPIDHPRPAAMSYGGGTVSSRLREDLSETLRMAAGQRGLTLFMLLLAAYEVLIFRHTGQEDLVIGTPIAGRDRIEAQGLIGFFVNMLAIRTYVSGDMAIPRLFGRVRKAALLAYSNKSAPFELIVETMRPERDLSRSSLFNVTFSLEQSLPPLIAMPRLEASALETHTDTSKFDLILSFADQAPGLTANFEYRRDLFDRPTIERLMQHLEILLEGIAYRTDCRICSLPLFSAAESSQLLEAWNDTSADYPADKCLHQLFEDQVGKTPDSIALIFDDRIEEAQVSYVELDRRANRLAHYLAGRGCGFESRIGVCAERSIEVVIAILGIMKTAAAYVPIDPAYPADRINYIISNAGVTLVIAGGDETELIPPLNAASLNLSEIAHQTAGEREDNPGVSGTSDSVIYLIYTSGSTGKPKGAAVSHRGVVNCLSWLQQRFEIEAGDRVLVKASLSFDASVWELFWPLVVGSSAVLAAPGGQRDGAYLANTISKLQVTVCHFVPSMLRVFVDQPTIESIKCLELVLCGGEALPLETMEDFCNRSSAELHNFYGPTETSIGSVDWRCSPGLARANLPIGRPISNTRLCVLDRQLSPAPVGVPGQLCISGDGVGMGYVGRADLTAEKFMPDLVSQEMGSRMYATGDLCRYLADGNIEFLGRIDHQVKIRGFRIELGEIEAAIAQHPSVGECVVLAREDLGNEKKLVAYVVAAGDSELPPAALRSFVKESLPAFMVPSYFVPLEELPLTPSGKVDRRALPLPDAGTPSDADFRGPQDAVEEMLANIWGEVLGSNHINGETHFFEHGGHSLLATQVASRIRAAFAVELPVKTVFENPMLSELARVIRSELTCATGEVAGPIVRADRGSFAVLSHAQERLWFLDQLEQDRAVYNSVAGSLMSGPLLVPALEEAVIEITRRHESLRTSFEVLAGEPVQVVHPFEPSGVVPIIDVSGLAEAEREAGILFLARQAAQRSFDLQEGPLFRTSLFRGTGNDHALVAFMHHIVSDGWSMGVLADEIGALYTAFSAGVGSGLIELPIQYADFAIWHRDYLKQGQLVRELDYWRKALAGAHPVLDMPFDRPRGVVQTVSGATAYFELSCSVTRQLHGLAKRERVTLFMLLLAAFQTLLHRYSGQDDLCVGSPIANRTRKEVEGLIGFFANTLVLRAQFEKDGTFRDLLGKGRQTMLEAYAHQDLPFEVLVEAIQPVRDLSHTPLFQVLFVLQNAPHREMSLDGLAVSPLMLDAGKAHFDLSFSITEEKGALQAAIEYNTDLFDEATIRRMFDHFAVLLSAANENPGLAVCDLPLLTSEETGQLLSDFNSTLCEFERDACVHELVERRVRSAPDTISLVFEGCHISYGCLDEEAEELAERLGDEGIGPDGLAALCIYRSIEMVKAILAVLKAGGAYVPLDPAYPQDRLAWMMQGIEALVAHQDVADRLPIHDAPVLDATSRHAHIGYKRSMVVRGALDHLEPPRPKAARENGLRPTPDSLAYVIYTSGSTGRPKGVSMSHRSAVKMISWQWRSSWQSGAGRTLQFASLSFDVSFQEIFSTLSAGGTLVLISDDDRKDASRLLETIVREQVERLFVPVVALNGLAESCPDDDSPLTALREVIAAGEQLKITPEVSALFERMPSCALFNHYGPSETHAATAWTPPAEHRTWPYLAPIGKPIDNTTVYLLDSAKHLAPIGISGEIHIGGDGLARGYLGQPAMTGERFLPDPFAELPGSRFYASGDLGRYRQGGTIEYLGRSDHQLKIRGHRVEPGEIEIVMRQADWVKQAVVLATELGLPQKRDKREKRDKQLIAYVVAQQDLRPDIVGLKALLKQRLPEYMRPSVILQLDEMPLTGSGKIDRQRLPAVPDVRAAVDHSGNRFNNVVEEVAAEVFCSTLGINGIGPDYNFFDEGGNSLTATRVISRLRTAFNIDLPLRRIFEFPTVTGLAACIEDELKLKKRPAAPAIQRVDRNDAIPLSFAQQRMWFLHTLAPDSPAYNISGAIRIIGSLDDLKLEQAVNKIISRHEILRTSFRDKEGQPVQVIHSEAGFKLERLAVDGGSGAASLELALEQACQFGLRAFDLSSAPLLRGLLIRLNETEHLLALSMHHIVSDGASIDVFLRELSAMYGPESPDVGATLPELKIQYADYAAWQREWLAGDRLEEELTYWRRTLGGGSEAIELPIDRARPFIQTFNGSTVKYEIPVELAHAAKSLGRREASTVFMTFLAVFQVLLHKYSGQSDVWIGVPVANRSLPEVQHLIGFFVNTTVLRVQVDRHGSFSALLRQVRSRAVEAFTHQDVPFERLVDELQPERDLSRSPLFQAAFASYRTSSEDCVLEGLRVEQLEVESRTSKFDLFASIEESHDKLTAVLEYNIDLFDNSTIERLGHHLVTLGQALIADPERPVREASVLSKSALAQFISEWNDTELRGYTSGVFSDLFEDIVERCSDSTAIVDRDLALTYAGLNMRANRLAWHLVEAGLAPEQTVALVLNRSAEMIVAMLAAFKAGAAFLPLDPSNPESRLRIIADASRTSYVIGEPSIGAALAGSSVPFLPVDRVGDLLARYAPDNLGARSFPENLAYVIFTSGSTGLPKGVAVEQRHLMSYIRAITHRLKLDTGISMAALSTPSADLGYTATFGALAAGGCLHIIPEGLFLDGEGLAGYFELHHIDCLKTVPSHLAALHAASEPRVVLPRKILVLGGEASSAAWARSLRSAFPRISVVNHYGPTETTVGVSTVAVRDDELVTRSNTLPIGRPLANARTYLLTEDLEPVPIGAKGHLYIGGRTVSRGYLDQADLIAETFIPEHLSGEFGSRMYCSNDIGRYLADGTIEFQGRSDDQVKIHGYRVEPKEVEQVLLAHPDVRQASVLPRRRDNRAASIELAAYVVPTPARSRSIGGRARYILANGMAIVDINKNETDYIYREIFELKAYQRFGMHIEDAGVVLDVGANIGLFTLWISQHKPNAIVYAFEPNPSVFEVLKVNTSLYAPNVRLFNYGLGNRERIADFTSFPGFTLFSGLYAAGESEKEVVKRFIANQAATSGIGASELIEASEELLNEKFQSESFPVRLRTLSDVIDETGMDRIDLLKINAEKSELEVLQGIKSDHWARIGQVVLEVDLKANLSEVTGMLKNRGYEVNVMQDSALEGTELFYCYARRAGTRALTSLDDIPGSEAMERLQVPLLTADELGRFLAQTLPDYMIPRTITVLESMPVAGNGKIDRAALPDPDGVTDRRETRFEPPGNSIERTIASVWQEVLGVGSVGVNENFFHSGGNSLLLAQVCGRLRRILGRAITVMELFRYPTVHSLAMHLSNDYDTAPSESPHRRRGLERRRALALRTNQLRISGD